MLGTTLQAGSPPNEDFVRRPKSDQCDSDLPGTSVLSDRIAAHFKAGFQSRAEITTTGFVAAAIFAGLGVLVFLFSFTKKQS